jgi:hypothetical protein
LIVLRGLDHLEVGEGGLDPLGQAALLAGEHGRGHPLAEVELVGHVEQHLGADLLGRRQLERVDRNLPRSGVDQQLAVGGRLLERHHLPPVFGLRFPFSQGGAEHLFVVELVRVARPERDVVPLPDQLGSQRLRDHSRADDSDLHGVLRPVDERASLTWASRRNNEHSGIASMKPGAVLPVTRALR